MKDLTRHLGDVSRVEVIDNKGRSYVLRRDGMKVSLSLQDQGRTLKVFIAPPQEGPQHVCGLQGFGRGIGSENDECPACRAVHSQGGDTR